jgi:hypothetical protein
MFLKDSSILQVLSGTPTLGANVNHYSTIIINSNCNFAGDLYIFGGASVTITNSITIGVGDLVIYNSGVLNLNGISISLQYRIIQNGGGIYYYNIIAIINVNAPTTFTKSCYLSGVFLSAYTRFFSPVTFTSSVTGSGSIG